MSKIKKFLLMSVITFFILIISNSVYAREINNITELGEEIEYANPNTETVYVIGDYVFTKKITIKDVMLASTSIKVSDKTNTDEMVIYKLEKNFETKKWEPVKNYVGTKQWILSEDSPMNICYMDYDGVKNIYKVTFNTDGGNSIDSVKVHDGDTVSEPTTPTKEGYVFKGWYKEETKYEFNTPVTGDIELKAKWAKISKFSAQTVTSDSTAATTLKNSYDWNYPAEYKPEFNTVENTVNVTGIIPIVTGLKEGTFSGDHLTEYYLAFTITTTEEVTDDTTVKISGNGEDKTLTGKDFETDKKNMYILKHLHKDDKTRKFTIEIDLDGSEKDAYEPYTITVNWQYLKLQEYSSISNVEIATTGNNITDKQYDFTKNGATIAEGDSTDYKLTGEVKKQLKVTDGEGYYVPLKITLPKGCKDTAIVKLKRSEKDENLTGITSDSMGNVYLTVLVSLDEGQKSTPITLEVDLDGTGSNYCAKTYTIDYSNVTFTPERTVTFKYDDGKTGDKQVKVCDGDKVSSEEAKPTKDYHTFLYWADAEGKYDFGKAVNQNIELTPHWQLDVDKFVKDVVENGTFTEFTLEKNNHTITFNLPQKGIASTKIADTSLAEAIEYVLNKKEVTKISLSLDGTKKEFIASDGKDKIKEGINDLLKSYSTLDDMLNKSLILKVEEFSKNVQLADGENGEYTIKFDAKFRVVNNNDELVKAVSNTNIANIYLKNDISLEDTLNIGEGRKVTIEPLDSTVKTISITAGKNYVINIGARANITLKNLKVTGAKKGFYVYAGTTDNMTTVNIDNLDVSGNTEAGIEIKNNVSNVKLTGSGLQYDNEDYNHPAITTDNKTKAVVNIAGVTAPITYETITKNHETNQWTDDDFKIDGKYSKVYDADEDGTLDAQWQGMIGTTRNNYPDHKATTNTINYYVNSNHSKIYGVLFKDSRTGLIIMRYRIYNDELMGIDDNEIKNASGSTYFAREYTRDGNTYVHVGWTVGNTMVTVQTNVTQSLTYDSLYVKKDNAYTVKIGDKTFYVLKEDVELSNITRNKKQTTIADIIADHKDAKTSYEALEKQVGGSIKIIDKKTKQEITKKTVVSSDLEIIAADPDTVTNEIISVPSSATSNGYSMDANGKISGILNENEKYFTLTLSSENFQDGTTVGVIDPNGTKTSYIYDGSKLNEQKLPIANHANPLKIMNVNTINLDTIDLKLEAIKQSNIQNNGSKEYQVIIDIDGNGNKYIPNTYAINYEGLSTKEEAINVAAEATKNATSITLTNKNTTNKNSQNWTEKYNKAENRRLITDNITNEKSYTFSSKGNKFYDYRDYRDLYKEHNSNLAYTDSISYDPTTKNPGEYYNGWRYNNNGYHGFGNIEIELLYDTKKDGETIQAISKIEKVDDTTYKVTITKERFDNWLDEYYGIIDYQYELNENLTNPEELGVTGDVVLTITLTSDAKYISSIKSDTITINKGTKGNETRTIDITISDANNTDVPDIYKILEIENGTEEEKQKIVEDFVARGRQWWEDNK